ncbi:MAG: carbohydrate ABC transporter permease [Trueperaceae bacterium]|nr:carbohydrate ABC transporter permease [Trueperaceae bacterium]
MAAQPSELRSETYVKPKSIFPRRWYAHLILLIAVVIIGFPLFYAILVATQTNMEVIRYQFFPGTGLRENWNFMINQLGLGRFMLNSLFISVTVAIGKVLFSLLAGLGLVYFRYPGKWLIFGFIILTLMTPTDVLAIALFRLVNAFHWADTYAALTVPFFASATSVFLFRQHFKSIPPELSEAAQLDGANPFQFLFKVLIPLSWSTIGAIVVIMFLDTWNQYLWPLLIIRSQEQQVVQVGIAKALVEIQNDQAYGPLMMGAVLASLPPLIVFLLLQKQFMKGFALTRDK